MEFVGGDTFCIEETDLNFTVKEEPPDEILYDNNCDFADDNAPLVSLEEAPPTFYDHSWADTSLPYQNGWENQEGDQPPPKKRRGRKPKSQLQVLADSLSIQGQQAKPKRKKGKGKSVNMIKRGGRPSKHVLLRRELEARVAAATNHESYLQASADLDNFEAMMEARKNKMATAPKKKKPSKKVLAKRLQKKQEKMRLKEEMLRKKEELAERCRRYHQEKKRLREEMQMHQAQKKAAKEAFKETNGTFMSLPKARGRPRKPVNYAELEEIPPAPVPQLVELVFAQPPVAVTSDGPAPKKRGRPKKNPTEMVVAMPLSLVGEQKPPPPPPAKGRRGRPKKVVEPEPIEFITPVNIDDIIGKSTLDEISETRENGAEDALLGIGVTDSDVEVVQEDINFTYYSRFVQRRGKNKKNAEKGVNNRKKRLKAAPE